MDEATVDEVVAHLDRLVEAGLSCEQISEVSGVSVRMMGWLRSKAPRDKQVGPLAGAAILKVQA